MTDKIIVLTTCSSEEAARELANHLVELRLAACVSVLPASSHYRWKGAVEQAQEWMLMIKSARGLYQDLQREILRVHKYELPEVIAMVVADGSPLYLS